MKPLHLMASFMLALTALAAPAPDVGGSPPDIRAFRPSIHGFKFRNAFKGSPLPVSLGSLDSAIGPGHYGLCGGMSAAVADFFLAQRAIPAQSGVPEKGAVLYDYIFSRQVDSLGGGLTEATRFARWMRLPDGGPCGTRARSLPSMSDTESRLHRGEPVMLGLVLTSRKDKGRLWENHQVMAYDVHRSNAGEKGVSWTVRIYDPNFPGIDDARLEMRLTCEGVLPAPATVGGLATSMPMFGVRTVRRATGKADTAVRGVFLMPYSPVEPSKSL